jgi:integrase
LIHFDLQLELLGYLTSKQIMSSPFLNEVRNAIRARHYTIRTERTYIYWIRFYIRFHSMKHPKNMGAVEVVQFLEFLAVERNVCPATQMLALNALAFLYKQVLQFDEFILPGYVRAIPRKKIPVVLTREEVNTLLNALQGITDYAHNSCMDRTFASWKWFSCVIRISTSVD